MLRKSIIMMALATAFIMNVSAVQIKVPEGQPPMPGADASIPANAYEDYRHINKVAEQEVYPSTPQQAEEWITSCKKERGDSKE